MLRPSRASHPLSGSLLELTRLGPGIVMGLLTVLMGSLLRSLVPAHLLRTCISPYVRNGCFKIAL